MIDFEDRSQPSAPVMRQRVQIEAVDEADFARQLFARIKADIEAAHDLCGLTFATVSGRKLTDPLDILHAAWRDGAVALVGRSGGARCLTHDELQARWRN